MVDKNFDLPDAEDMEYLSEEEINEDVAFLDSEMPADPDFMARDPEYAESVETEKANTEHIKKMCEKYDAAGSSILRDPTIQAILLQEVYPFLKIWPDSWIVENCIQGNVQYRNKKIDKEDHHLNITGIDTAHKSPTEGNVYFDLFYEAILPIPKRGWNPQQNESESSLAASKRVSLDPKDFMLLPVRVDCELESQTKVEQDEIGRGCYYEHRNGSDQKNTTFQKTDYKKLHGTLSIWINQKPRKKAMNRIEYYQMWQEMDQFLPFWKLRRGVMINVVAFNLGDPDEPGIPRALRMLDIIFCEEIPRAKKVEMLDKEFGVHLLSKVNKEFLDMENANLSNAWLELGRSQANRIWYEKHTAQVQQERIETVRNVCRNTGMTVKDALHILGYSEEIQQQILEQLTETDESFA